jgi:hypothetical protein
VRFHLAEVGAGAAGLELAVLALKDEPVRAGVAHVAHPLDEATLRLQDLEGVHAASRDGHCSEIKLWVVLVVSSICGRCYVEVRIGGCEVILSR